MLDIAARTVLFPVLVLQAAFIRRRALKLPEAVGRRVGISGLGPDLSLLIIGDSSAAGVGTSHQEEALLGSMRKRLSQTNTVHWSVDAKTGATTGETLARLNDTPRQKFDIVSISLGVNDITGLVSQRAWVRQYEALLSLVETKFQADVICVSGIPHMEYFPLLPQPLRWVLGAQAARFDKALRKLIARHRGCRYIALDFKPDTSLMSADGFHPGPKIYAEWGRRIYCAIRKDIKLMRIKGQTGRII